MPVGTHFSLCHLFYIARFLVLHFNQEAGPYGGFLLKQSGWQFPGKLNIRTE